jgi:protein gp37
MGKDSRIEWTHHTFNPWWGCVKVSPACDHCYAEAWAKRVGSQVWGPESDRRMFTDAHWREPLKWNAEAVRSGRRRVFCASMADVFENRSDLVAPRARLFELIEATPHLDWLLLTKRIHLVRKLAPKRKGLPSNVWLGTTVENQEYARKRIPYLLKHVEASVRFLSCEPLLSAIDLSPFIDGKLPKIDWVIAGGESGPGARAMHPGWVTALHKQCRQHRIAFHFKQWGHWAPQVALVAPPPKSAKQLHVSGDTLLGVGKHAAGRFLGGRTWDEFPVAARAAGSQ